MPSKLEINGLIYDPERMVLAPCIDEHDFSDRKEHLHINDDSLTPHMRLLELAAILATGIHRLRSIHSALPECAQLPADSSQPGLDDGGEFALMEPGLHLESEDLDAVH